MTEENSTFSAEDLAAIKEIAGEDHDPDFSGPQSASSEKKRFTKSPFYKLLNPTPGGPALEKAGIRMDTYNAEGEKQQEVVEKVRAVILYASDIRTFKRGKQGEIACQSFNGVQPAPRIVAPPCKKLDSDGVAAVIQRFRGMTEARITEQVAELTGGTGVLSFCTIKTKTGGYIPVCPMARYDEERGTAGPCKPGISILAFDVDRKRVFKMELSGRNVRDDKKMRSPFQSFRHMLGEARVPSYAFVVELTAVPDAEPGAAQVFYTLGVKAKPITKPENRKEMAEKAIEARDLYMRIANWVKKPDAPVTEPKTIVPPKPAPVAPLSTKPAPVVAPVVPKKEVPLPASFEDDDLSFGTDDEAF